MMTTTLPRRDKHVFTHTNTLIRTVTTLTTTALLIAITMQIVMPKTQTTGVAPVMARTSTTSASARTSFLSRLHGPSCQNRI